jgi:transglutaminase-like putative cysteine protease
MRRIAFSLFFLILVFLTLPKAFASPNFSTDYNVTYTISSSAETNVSIDVSLTNLTDNYYASSYDIEVGFTDLRNLRGELGGQGIGLEVKKTQEGSKIHIPFTERVVGKDSKLNFRVSFITNQVAENLNNVWDINIPGVSKKSDFSNFNVRVVYPSSLGKPAYIKPLSRTLTTNGNIIDFTREDLGESGISLAFGEFQVYDFNLTYHLQNQNLFDIKTEIALPPSTNYQDVIISNITPKPSNVYIDKDENWMAEFIIKPSQKIDVKVKGQARVYLTPREKRKTEGDLSTYLKGTEYWEVNEPEIKKLAAELKTPQQIYNYVVKTLNYDFSRVETQSPRLGGVGVLRTPQSAVCLEFTDLFIAIARAAGIPARAVNGYAYTENSRERPLSFIQDILHAWPEYYDKERSSWVMVDPTWGNTTGGVDYFNVLDFDHFTFVKNGVKSNYPIPAGGYKFSDNLKDKDVVVTVAKEFKKVNANLNPTINIKDNNVAGLAVNGKILIENKSGVLADKGVLSLYSDNLKPEYQEIEYPQIPPYGKVELSFKFSPTEALTNRSDVIRISLDGKSAYKNIHISPFFLDKWFLTGGALIVTSIIAIPIAAAGLRRIYLQRQRRKNNLRGESNQPTQKSI